MLHNGPCKSRRRRRRKRRKEGTQELFTRGGRLRLARKQEGQSGGQLAVLVPCEMRTWRRIEERMLEIPLRLFRKGGSLQEENMEEEEEERKGH